VLPSASLATYTPEGKGKLENWLSPSELRCSHGKYCGSLEETVIAGYETTGGVTPARSSLYVPAQNHPYGNVAASRMSIEK
jgi:hypothetical protein